MKLMREVCTIALMSVVFSGVSFADLTELAWYRLGEDDAGAANGGSVGITVDSIDGRAFGQYRNAGFNGLALQRFRERTAHFFQRRRVL